MKKCLLLFYWACTVCMLYAQDKNTSSFLFDVFKKRCSISRTVRISAEKGLQHTGNSNFILLIVLIIR